jgi:hypothetical protein
MCFLSQIDHVLILVSKERCHLYRVFEHFLESLVYRLNLNVLEKILSRFIRYFIDDRPVWHVVYDATLFL